MATVFINLPTPVGNGAGAAVDVSAFAATKTFVSGGNGFIFEPFVTIEISNDVAGTNFAPIHTFQGQPGNVTIPIAARWARAVVSNYRGGIAPQVDLGADTDPAFFATLVAPAGNGTGFAVATSALPNYKTVQVAGTFRGSVNIEISEDGADWSTVMSFQAPGVQSASFTADFMRVTRVGVPTVDPGLPLIDIAADSFGGGLSDGGVFLSAGTQSASTGMVVLSNSNGVSFGMNASTITATFAAIKTISAGTTNATGQGISFGDGGGITFGLVGNTVTASVQTVGGTASGVGISAGTVMQTSGVVSFANSNGISFGLNASTLTAAFDGIRSVIAGTQTAAGTANATVSFANSNGVTFGMSGSNTITASVASQVPETPFAFSAGTQSVSTGTVSFVNSNGVSFGMSGSNSITATFAAIKSISAGTTFATGQGISFAQGPVTDGGNAITWNLNGNTLIGEYTLVPETPFAISAGTQSVSTGTVSFANANGVTFGMSGSNVITASVAAGGGGAALSAGTQSVSTGTVAFVNSNGVSFGLSGSSQLTISVSHVQVAEFRNNDIDLVFGLTNGQEIVNRVSVPAYMTATQAVMHLSMSGASDSTGALSVSFGVYTMSASTASLVSSASRLISWSSGSETTASSIYGGVSGVRYRTMDLGTFNVTPGDYIFAWHMRTSNAGSWSYIGHTSSGSFNADFEGPATNLFINGQMNGGGSFTTAMVASFNVTDTNYVRTGAAPQRMPGIHLFGSI